MEVHCSSSISVSPWRSLPNAQSRLSHRQLGPSRRKDWGLSWYPAFEETARVRAEKAWKKRSKSASSSLSCQNTPKQKYPGMTGVTRNHQSTYNWFCKKTSSKGILNYNCTWNILLMVWLQYLNYLCAFPTPARLAAYLKIPDIWTRAECKKWTFCYYYSSTILCSIILLHLRASTSPRNKVCLKNWKASWDRHSEKNIKIP